MNYLLWILTLVLYTWLKTNFNKLNCYLKSKFCRQFFKKFTFSFNLIFDWTKNSCESLGLIEQKHILNYLTFQSFEFELTWWRLFQKCIVGIKFDNVKIFKGLFWLFMYSLRNTDDLSTLTELFLWTGKLLFDCLLMFKLFVEDLYFMLVSSILLLERNFDGVAQICEVGLKHLLIVKKEMILFSDFCFFKKSIIWVYNFFPVYCIFCCYFCDVNFFAYFIGKKLKLLQGFWNLFFFFFN